MTFAETDKLLKAINYLETWARAMQREINNEEVDEKQVAEYQKWIDEAKQEIFEFCTK
tara:strand:- start:425 stop:598 length:174 start_codon:yes stop_codon:yes gene_type:complete